MARYKHIDTSPRFLAVDLQRQLLTAHPENRKGSKGATRKSNRTDNESAKMATSKGVIQGYTGVAGLAVTWRAAENQPIGPPSVTVPGGASDGGDGRGCFMYRPNVKLRGCALLRSPSRTQG